MSEKQERGVLSARVAQRGRELLGREMTQKELRLMPYLMDVSMNGQLIDWAKVNSDEETILDEWQAQGFITLGENDKVTISADFWHIISDLIYLAYVDLA